MNQKKPKYLNDGDKWVLAEEIPDIDFQFAQIWLSAFVNDLEKTIGINYKKVLSIHDGYNLKFYYGDKDSELVSSTILKNIIEDNLAKDINKNIRLVADKLFDITKSINREYLQSLTGKQLSDFYKQLDDIHTEFYQWCWLPNAVDMFHTHFTNYLKDILKKYLQSEEEINIALVALSFSEEKSFVQEELESLLDIAIFKKEHPEDTSTFEKIIKQHHDNFFFLKHLWIGKDGVSTIEEYKQAVEKILSDYDPSEALDNEKKTWSDSKKLRDEYESKIKLTNPEKDLFRQYAEFAFTKAYRRKVQLYWAYKMDFIFEELSKRFGISFMEARFLVPDEIYTALDSGFTSEMIELVKKRSKHCVYYGEKDLEIVAVGEECSVFEKTIQTEEYFDIQEFKGQVACVGKVKGVVKIINIPSDMAKVNEGDILVSIATNPDILPAMKRASAFVTEQGGITSHAAIVAREMKKPCIIGTRIATKVLKDGDMVEVDAEKGIVRKLK